MKKFIVDTGKKKYIVEANDAEHAVEIVKNIDDEASQLQINDANIIYIKICKVCDHYKPGNKGYCDILGGYQAINVANNCPYFSGEKYAFDRDRAYTVGERPSTFSKRR